MADTKSINPADVEQGGIILHSIAEQAKAIEMLAAELIADGDVNFDHFKCVAIRELAAKVGYMADLGADKLGAFQQYGDAEDWLLPLSYRMAEQRAHCCPAQSTTHTPEGTAHHG
jgi:hypothetical protein